MSKTRSNKTFKPSFGWNPDVPDQRDHTYAAPLARLTAKARMPVKVDLRKYCPPIYNQGNIGSCTANAIAAALEFDRKKQKLSAVPDPTCKVPLVDDVKAIATSGPLRE